MTGVTFFYIFVFKLSKNTETSKTMKIDWGMVISVIIGIAAFTIANNMFLSNIWPAGFAGNYETYAEDSE